MELERQGRLRAVVTQNIDELHQRAGHDPDRVVELHGTMWRVRCWSCGEEGPMEPALDRVRAGDDDPHCERCGGILKSATISFGQSLDPEVLGRAEDAALDCDLLLAVGSTLSVYPAAGLVPLAYRNGASVVIVNAQPTPLRRSGRGGRAGPHQRGPARAGRRQPPERPPASAPPAGYHAGLGYQPAPVDDLADRSSRSGPGASVGAGQPRATTPMGSQPSGTPSTARSRPASPWIRKNNAPNPSSTAPSSSSMVAKAVSMSQYGAGHAASQVAGRCRLCRAGRSGRGRPAGCRTECTRTGACSTPGWSGRASQAGSASVDQNRPVWSRPSSTTKAQPWVWPADGARRARSSRRSTTSGGTGSSWKCRHMRRRRMASSSSTALTL